MFNVARAHKIQCQSNSEKHSEKCVQLDGMRLIPCDCASQTPSQAHREKNVIF